ncbi:MAG: DPP IV N-terminal domain-containing protein, partial [Candidatus Aminicenantales bacterium]
MKKLPKPAVLVILFLAVLMAGPSFTQEKQAPTPAVSKEIPVGRALYDKLRKEGRNLVKFDGLARLNWTSDGKAYYVFEDGTFKRVDLPGVEKSPLFDDVKLVAAVNLATGRQEAKLPFNRFEYLEDGAKIQFAAFNKVFIYDLAAGKLVFYDPERTVSGVRGRGYGDVLSPDLKLRAFTRNYNLYVKDMDGNETALTADGTEDLRNGFPDWVYPEELGQYQAFWWSPDSKKIAFMQFDESPVAKYPIVHDIAPMPRYELQGYPVPGANNPIVRLFVADVASKKIVRLETGDDMDVYLYRG